MTCQLSVGCWEVLVSCQWGVGEVLVSCQRGVGEVLATYIHHFQVLPAGLFSNLFTTNARFRG